MTRQKLAARLLLSLAVPSAFLGATPAIAAPAAAPDAKAAIAEQFARLPMVFEANQGQNDPAVRFQARGIGYGFYLTASEAVLNLDVADGAKSRRSSLRTRLVGANADAPLVGEAKLPGTTNYLSGAKAADWKTGIEQFGKVRYQGVYPGIDLVYYGTQNQVEYDYVVAPGSDPSAIVMDIKGAKSLKLASNGDLEVATEAGTLVQHKPVIYQTIDGKRQAVDGRYKLRGSKVSFEVAEYDRNQTLVIDPLLAFNAYSPGLHREIANAVAVGGDGSAYIAGYSTPYSYASRIRFISDDAFVTKINPTGTAIVYATYLGGAAADRANAIKVDATGAVYVSGDTFSNDFPVVNAVQTARAGFRDGFALKLSPDGRTIIYSTYLGGVADDSATALAIDATGASYIAGLTSSLDFPVAAALQATNAGRADAFVTKLNAAGAMVYSTYLGGAIDDGATGIALDATGAAYISGFSDSFNLPVTPGAFQPARTPNLIIPDDPATNFNEFRSVSYGDAFVAKLNGTGASLDYLTYLGGIQEDTTAGIAVDGAGNAFVTGYTDSSNFPVANAYRSTLTGSRDIFVTKLNSNASALVYSTYFGGESFNEYATGIALDAAGTPWVTGYTSSISMPTRNPLQRANSGNEDAFVVNLNAAGNGLNYASYLGAPGRDYANGVATDAAGNVYLTGYTFSTNFTTTRAPIQGAAAGRGDPFVTKFAAGGASLAYSTYLGETNLFLSLALGQNNPGRNGPQISLPLPLRGIIGCTLRAVDGVVLAGTELLFPTRVVCGGDQAPPG